MKSVNHHSIHSYVKKEGSSTFSVGLPILIAYWI